MQGDHAPAGSGNSIDIVTCSNKNIFKCLNLELGFSPVFILQAATENTQKQNSHGYTGRSGSYSLEVTCNIPNGDGHNIGNILSLNLLTEYRRLLYIHTLIHAQG